jgi:hypothetical protein
VADEIAKKSSVRKSVVHVPAGSPPLGLSSLALVKKTEPVAAGALESDDPFRFGQLRLVPHVGEPTIARGESLSLYLTAFTGKGAEPASELQLEFLGEGQLIGRTAVVLPAPDERGRIPYIATIPSDAFPPGRIELRATVRRGGHSTDASTFFNVTQGGS